MGFRTTLALHSLFAASVSTLVWFVKRFFRARTPFIHALDNSNVFIHPMNNLNRAVDYAKLYDFACARRKRIPRGIFAVGSWLIPTCHGVNNEHGRSIKRAGFDTLICHRLPGQKEKVVDSEMFQRTADLFRELTDGYSTWEWALATRGHIPRPTVVLTTGDGNFDNVNCSFPELVKSAIDNGFCVEVLTWQACCAGIYKNFVNQYGPDMFRLRFLDDSILV
jgi:hypothetical protein